MPDEDDEPIREIQPRPRRRRDEEDREDDYRRERVTGDSTGGLIPYKNPKALLGYYISIFGFFLPLIGSVIAIVFGFQGLGYVKKHPEAKGTAHAVVALVLGFLGAGFWSLALLGIVVSVVVNK